MIGWLLVLGMVTFVTGAVVTFRSITRETEELGIYLFVLGWFTTVLSIVGFVVLELVT